MTADDRPQPPDARRSADPAQGPPPDVLDALEPRERRRVAARARPAASRVAAVLRAAAPAALTAHEIASALGIHHTAVRAQLSALRGAGAVEESVDPPAGRGRPATRYRLAPDPTEREAAGHRELVHLLMGLVGQAGFLPEDVALFGERHGRSIARAGAGAAEIRDVFDRLGFAPREAGEKEIPDLVLGRCPFADGVEATGGHLICELHHGLARGIAETAAPEVEVTDLVVEAPRTAGCRLRLSPRERRAGDEP